MFDPFSGNFYPRAAVSGEAEYSDGKLYSAGLYEQNLFGPPLWRFTLIATAGVVLRLDATY